MAGDANMTKEGWETYQKLSKRGAKLTIEGENLINDEVLKEKSRIIFLGKKYAVEN